MKTEAVITRIGYMNRKVNGYRIEGNHKIVGYIGQTQPGEYRCYMHGSRDWAGKYPTMKAAQRAIEEAHEATEGQTTTK